MAPCMLYGMDLAAPVVNGNMGDGGCMTRHLPHLSVGAALPQQDVPFQSPTGAVTVCRTLHRDRSVILIVLSREHVTKPSSCMLETCCSIYGCYALVYDVSTCLVHLIYTSVTCTLDWVITHNMELTRLDFRCSQSVAVFEG